MCPYMKSECDNSPTKAAFSQNHRCDYSVLGVSCQPVKDFIKIDELHMLFTLAFCIILDSQAPLSFSILLLSCLFLLI